MYLNFQLILFLWKKCNCAAILLHLNHLVFFFQFHTRHNCIHLMPNQLINYHFQSVQSRSKVFSGWQSLQLQTNNRLTTQSQQFNPTNQCCKCRVVPLQVCCSASWCAKLWFKIMFVQRFLKPTNRGKGFRAAIEMPNTCFNCNESIRL